jgi:hypothetical protein
VLTIGSNAIGSAEITDGTVSNADLAGSIALAKLSATGTPSATTYLRGDNTWATVASGLPGLTAASIWVGNAGGAATAVALSGDATLSNAGALTIGTGAITSAKIADGTVVSADIADGTIAVTDMAATGTKDNTTFLRGDDTWAAPPAGGGGASNYQTFTANGTWTKPASGNLVLAECWGGGGSGARHSSNSTNKGGGGGGGYNSRFIPLASISGNVVVTIGAGGTAVSANGAGNSGGNTTFGAYLTAYGGAGGQATNGGGGGGQMGAGSTNMPGAPLVVAYAGPCYMSSSDNYGTHYSYYSYSYVQGQGGTASNNSNCEYVSTHSAGQRGFMHGGGGGGGDFTDAGSLAGGASLYGGGGGGGAFHTNVFGAAGGSTYGGAGGAAAATGAAGTQPGGGGGAAVSGASGAGAAGMCRVTTF